MSGLIRTTLIASALALGLAGTASAQSAPNATDTRFMQQAASDGIAEVQMGQLALEKASDPQVKELARRIVADHTKANGHLRALAVRKHVKLPATTTVEAQREAADMKAMDGQQFDQAWSNAMVKDHLKAIDLFATESQQAKDADVRKFTDATTPALQTHLQMAQKLAGAASTTGTTP